MGAVPQGREIGRGVAEPAIGLPDEERDRGAVLAGDSRHEHPDRALGLGRDPAGEELVDDLGQERVVGALATDVLVGQQHAQLAIGRSHVDERLVDQRPPVRPGVRVAGLEQHHPPAGSRGEDLVLVEARLRLLVEGVEVGDAAPSLPGLDEALDQHAELGAPVPEVVLADDLVSEMGVEPHQAVAEDRRAEVTDVHLLRSIRARVVDQHAQGRVDPRHAQSLVARANREQVREVAPVESDVDEAGPGDLGRLGDPGQVELPDDRRGDVSGRARERLRQAERRVRLEVAEAGILRRTELRISAGMVGSEGRRDRAREPRRELLEGIVGGERDHGILPERGSLTAAGARSDS